MAESTRNEHDKDENSTREESRHEGGEEEREFISSDGERRIEERGEGENKTVPEVSAEEKEGEEEKDDEERRRKSRQSVVEKGKDNESREEEDDDPVVSEELVYLDFPELSYSLFFSSGDSSHPQTPPFSSSVLSVLESQMHETTQGVRPRDLFEGKALESSSSCSPSSLSSSSSSSSSLRIQAGEEASKEKDEAGCVRIAKTLSRTRRTPASISKTSEEVTMVKKICRERGRSQADQGDPFLSCDATKDMNVHETEEQPLATVDTPATSDASLPLSSSSSSSFLSSSSPSSASSSSSSSSSSLSSSSMSSSSLSSSSSCTVELYGLESSSPVILVNGCLSFSGRHTPQPPLETIVFLEERQSTGQSQASTSERLDQEPESKEEQNDEEGEFLKGSTSSLFTDTESSFSLLEEKKKTKEEEQESDEEENRIVGLCTKTIEFVVDLQGKALKLSRSIDEMKRQQQREGGREKEEEKTRRSLRDV